MKKIQILVLMGLFIAIGVVFKQFLAVQISPTIKITFWFIPLALGSIILGPVTGGIIGAVTDVLSMLIFPVSAPYFPGFTLSALISGALYGMFLYKREISVMNIVLAVLASTLVVDLGLNTLWLSMLYKEAWIVLIAGRIIKSAAMFPVQIVMIYTLWKYIGVYIRRNYLVR